MKLSFGFLFLLVFGFGFQFQFIIWFGDMMGIIGGRAEIVLEWLQALIMIQ